MKWKPKQPDGFIPINFKNKVMNKGTESEYSGRMCPECGGVGSVWGPQGFTDPNIEAIKEEKGWEVIEEKDMWSRFCWGECSNCKCKFWHDFIMNEDTKEWSYYYQPKEQSTLSMWGVKRDEKSSIKIE